MLRGLDFKFIKTVDVWTSRTHRGRLSSIDDTTWVIDDQNLSLLEICIPN